MTDIYNQTKITEQNVYDAYNTLIFSGDSRVFNKMAKKNELYREVKDLPGDILEFGVFKGAGLGIFLNLKRLYEPNSLMKVIGFDFFNPSTLSAPRTSITSVFQRNSILGLFFARSAIILDARNSPRR